MSAGIVPTLLTLSFTALLAIAMVMLMFVCVVAPVIAAGVAREGGRPVMAVFALIVPVVTLIYVFKRPAAFAWLGRYLAIGFGCLAVGGALFYAALRMGNVTP